MDELYLSSLDLLVHPQTEESGVAGFEYKNRPGLDGLKGEGVRQPQPESTRENRATFGKTAQGPKAQWCAPP
jgi:hypothetical protein